MNEEQIDVVSDLSDFLKRLTLAAENERPQILREISPAITKFSEHKQFKLSLAESDFSLLFECFNSNIQSEIEVTSEILLKISDILDGGTIVVEKYPKAFESGLKNSNDQVKETHLRVLNKLVKHPSGTTTIKRNINLVLLAVELIAEKELSVGKHSMSFIESLVNIYDEKNGQTILFQDPILQLLQSLSKHESEIIRMRVYETLVNISKISPQLLECVSRYQFLQALCKELLKDDILLQLNCLELITDLAQVRHGRDFLESSSIYNQLEDWIEVLETSPSKRFIVPGLIKFFGVITRFHDNNSMVFYPKVKLFIQRMLTSEDEMETNLAIETFAFICENPLKKIIYVSDKANYGEIVRVCISKLKQSIKKGDNSDRSKALGLFANFIQLHDGPVDQMREESSINQGLVDLFDDKPISVLLEYAKLPILEISIMTYKIFKQLSCHQWGLELFQNHPGFMEFLLNRNISKEKEILQEKFDIIQTIAKNQSNIFSLEICSRITKYINDGPFYKPSDLLVALDV